jgi:hypothetical protein
MSSEKILNISKISSGYLVCIPEDVRKEIGELQPGKDKILWIKDLETGRIFVRKN